MMLLTVKVMFVYAAISLDINQLYYLQNYQVCMLDYIL